MATHPLSGGSSSCSCSPPCRLRQQRCRAAAAARPWAGAACLKSAAPAAAPGWSAAPSAAGRRSWAARATSRWPAQRMPARACGASSRPSSAALRCVMWLRVCAGGRRCSCQLWRWTCRHLHHAVAAQGSATLNPGVRPAPHATAAAAAGAAGARGSARGHGRHVLFHQRGGPQGGHLQALRRGAPGTSQPKGEAAASSARQLCQHTTFVAQRWPTLATHTAVLHCQGYVGRNLGDPGWKSTVRVGEAAMREVAAYLLDHDHFAQVRV
jgi:hypothetical protein